MPVVEFTRFVLARERAEELVVARAEMVKEFADHRRGFLAAYLFRVGDQEWIDLTIWETEADANAAMVHEHTSSSFFGLIEGILGQERGTLVSGLLGESGCL